MAMKKSRMMKIYGQSGYRYKATPTIMLKGQWLKDLGLILEITFRSDVRTASLSSLPMRRERRWQKQKLPSWRREQRSCRSVLSRRKRDFTHSLWRSRVQCTAYVRRCSDDGKDLYDRIL